MADVFEREKRFDKLLQKAPEDVRPVALHAIEHPHEPQYKLKKLHGGKRLRDQSWRICILNQQYRAICQRTGNRWIWYWFGTHEEYNNIIG